MSESVTQPVYEPQAPVSMKFVYAGIGVALALGGAAPGVSLAAVRLLSRLVTLGLDFLVIFALVTGMEQSHRPLRKVLGHRDPA
jgi:hypothetical protein